MTTAPPTPESDLGTVKGVKQTQEEAEAQHAEKPEQPALKPAHATEGESAEDKQKREEAVRSAYSRAQTTLRTRRQDEFNDLVKGFAAEAGYDWTPKPTASEKRRKQIEALLAEDPELAAEFGRSAD
jgi:hypothetical protein